MGVELSHEACDALFRKYDKNNNGALDAYEYASMLLLDLPQVSRKNYERTEAYMKKNRHKPVKIDRSSYQDNPQASQRTQPVLHSASLLALATLTPTLPRACRFGALHDPPALALGL